MLLSPTWDSFPHERRGGGGEHHPAMRGDVVTVGMADEDPFRAGLRQARIKPQAELRQVQAAGVQFHSQQ